MMTDQARTRVTEPHRHERKRLAEGENYWCFNPANPGVVSGNLRPCDWCIPESAAQARVTELEGQVEKARAEIHRLTGLATRDTRELRELREVMKAGDAMRQRLRSGEQILWSSRGTSDHEVVAAYDAARAALSPSERSSEDRLTTTHEDVVQNTHSVQRSRRERPGSPNPDTLP